MRAHTTFDGATGATDGAQYLTFALGDEEYGVAILKVQEIIGLQPITRVPRTPAFICGVINLRGKVIPIVDLREKFAMPAFTGSDAAVAARCIIVVQLATAAGPVVPMGLVVDRVSEVATIAEADVEDAPTFGAGVRTEYLLGLGKAQGRVKLLLDIDRVLAPEESEALPGVVDLVDSE